MGRHEFGEVVEVGRVGSYIFEFAIAIAIAIAIDIGGRRYSRRV